MSAIEDLLKKLRVEGVEVVTVSSPEELFSAIQGEEAPPVSEVVQDMTSDAALEYAMAANLVATREFARGHAKCSEFKQNASALWMQIHSALVQREAVAWQRESFERGWGDTRPSEPVQSDYDRGYSDALHDEGARLGLASNRELLEELKTRFKIPIGDADTASHFEKLIDELPLEALDYRTSSGKKADPVL